MKILLVNYRYFVSGGPERYLFNVKALLESHGHEVVPFSIAYAQNEPSEYAGHFAPPLDDSGSVYFREHQKDVRTYARTLGRAFYSPEVYRRLAALIDETRPDVAIVQHYLRKLSPAVLKCLADKRVPFAVRLSDFAMVCPNAHLLRGSTPCDLCVGGGLRHSVRHRCVQGSLGASAANYAATRFHQIMAYYDLIPQFIAPSRFTIGRMVAGGFAPKRLTHIPTFVTGREDDAVRAPRDAELVFVGRLEHIKGVHVLIAAVAELAGRSDVPQFGVTIIGEGNAEYARLLGDQAKGLANVRFAGAQDQEAVRAALRRASVSVVPSICYENQPNVALESMVEGALVVASSHGSFPEIVEHGKTGWLVAPEDASALAAAIRQSLVDPEGARAMARRGQEFVRSEHSPAMHYDRLMALFDRLGAGAPPSLISRPKAG